MKSINIKGKQYVPVNERLKYFREEEAYKGWQLLTEALIVNSDEAVFKCEIITDLGLIVSTGHAYEKADTSFINKLSHVENCETSAIGRALGNLGIGIDTSVASFEEVATAIKNQ